MDDADRYGPALELAKELHRRIEMAEIARNTNLPAEGVSA